MARLQIQMPLAVILATALINASCSSQSQGQLEELSVATQQNNAAPNSLAANTPATANNSTAADASPKANDSDGNTYWSSFRGPGGMGVSQSKRLPTAWSDSENLAWKSELPGAGSSSPTVWADRIFLTCYSGYFVPGGAEGSLDELTRHLVCLKQSSGEVIWDKRVKAKLPEETRIRDHGFAANTPAADSERIYAFFGKSGVHAYSHDGKPLWQADVGSNTHGWGTSASPVLYENLVFINASVESQSLIALDRSTGEEIWRAGGIKEAWNTPVIVKTESGDDELVVATHGKVFAFNPKSGERLWSCATDITWYMVPCVVAEEGVVYVLGGRSGIASLAVRAGGRGDVTESHRLWTSKKGSNVTSPVIHKGHLYWMHEKLGIAYCAQAETGELVYEERMNRAGQVYASTLLADGRLYYSNRSGKTFVVTAKPDFELLSTNDLRDGSLFNASPAVSGKQILIRSDKFLYCIGK